LSRKKHIKKWFRRLLAAIGIVVGSVLLLAGVAFALTNVWPNLGARSVDLARSVLGDRVVSTIENTILSSEDKVKQIRYSLLRPTPISPWQVKTIAAINKPTPLPTSIQTTFPTSSNGDNLPSIVEAQAGWVLDKVPPLGGIPGEGQWTPYLFDNEGNVVAYRTFLEPDSQRPYASVAVVAFNLQATQLHFVLGYDEPASSVYISRPSRIPPSDMVPGKILAAFNGGFKAQHGYFGVMVNGVTLIPLRDGFGTVVVYNNGKVALGAWGKDITTSPNIVILRQNGPLIVRDGQINPHTSVNDPQVWGYTTSGDTATGRSALGISLDGNNLFYAVGFDLTLPALARAIKAAGAYQAIQLDINNFYTHFEAFTLVNKNLAVVPLLDQMKGPGDHRYMSINSRDFFYLTIRNSD
jgi:hypothetical protein